MASCPTFGRGARFPAKFRRRREARWRNYRFLYNIERSFACNRAVSPSAPDDSGQIQKHRCFLMIVPQSEAGVYFAWSKGIKERLWARPA